MAISVMIQRTFSGNEKSDKLAPLIVKLRSLATIQPGYITGRTFRCLDCPGESFDVGSPHSCRTCSFCRGCIWSPAMRRLPHLISWARAGMAAPDAAMANANILILIIYFPHWS